MKIDVNDLSKTAVATLQLVSNEGSNQIEVTISLTPAPPQPITDETVKDLPAAHAAMIKILNLVDEAGFVSEVEKEEEKPAGTVH